MCPPAKQLSGKIPSGSDSLRRQLARASFSKNSLNEFMQKDAHEFATSSHRRALNKLSGMKEERFSCGSAKKLTFVKSSALNMKENSLKNSVQNSETVQEPKEKNFREALAQEQLRSKEKFDELKRRVKAEEKFSESQEAQVRKQLVRAEEELQAAWEYIVITRKYAREQRKQECRKLERKLQAETKERKRLLRMEYLQQNKIEVPKGVRRLNRIVKAGLAFICSSFHRQ